MLAEYTIDITLILIFNHTSQGINKKRIEDMKVKCDDKELTLTKDFVEAVKNMMFEEIIMFRVRRPENRDCWVVGACTISDIMSSTGFSFCFGGIDDKDFLFKDAHITVEVPL